MPHLYRYIICFIATCMPGMYALSQTVSGTVFDNDSKAAIQYVTLTNKRTGASTSTDVLGHFIIGALPGDTVFFAHPAFQFSPRVMGTQTKDVDIFIEKRRYQLREVEILSDMAKYKKDSAEKFTIYRKTLQDANHKTTLNFNNGIGATGLFSALALKVSGKEKRSRKFQEMLIADEQRKFIELRYNKPLVISLTGLSDSESEAFIEHYSIPYDFVRSASDLEIKMWIRNNYKKWQQIPHPAIDSTNTAEK